MSDEDSPIRTIKLPAGWKWPPRDVPPQAPKHCLGCGSCNDPIDRTPEKISIQYEYQCECGAYYGVSVGIDGHVYHWHHTAEEMKALLDYQKD